MHPLSEQPSPAHPGPARPDTGACAHRAAGGICVLVNAASGNTDADRIVRDVEACAATAAPPAEVRHVEPGKDFADAARRAVRDGFGTVVAAGGDGTVTGVVAGLIGSDTRLGIVPLGTFNFLARSLRIPESIDEAFRIVLEGRERPVAVGEINGQIFVNNASLGAYPAVLDERERTYAVFGRSRAAAHWSLVKTLLSFRSPLRMRVTVDGQTRRFRTPLVFVANNAYQLELFGLEGAGHLENGRFVLFVAPDAAPLDLLAMAGRLALGRLRPVRDFERMAGSDIVIETGRRSRTVALDGETRRLTAPFRVRRIENAVRVLVPPRPEGAP